MRSVPGQLRAIAQPPGQRHRSTCFFANVFSPPLPLFLIYRWLPLRHPAANRNNLSKKGDSVRCIVQ